MSEGSDRSGFFVSGALHAVLLGLIVVGFTQAPKFDDATESIPIDTITETQLNEIMHGERDAKSTKPTPPPPQRQLAVIEPVPPTPPEPPPDLRRVDDTPTPPDVPQPPAKPAPEPPQPPAKPAPEPPQPRAKAAPEPPQPPAKPTPAPPTRPVKPPTPPKPTAEEAPEPPPKPKTVQKLPQKPRETPPEKPKADAFAKMTAKDKTEPQPKEPTREAVAKPPTKSYDPNSIAKLLGQQTKLADATPTGATPQGLPTQHAARMSPSLSASLDAWFTDAYLSCWSPPPTTPEGERYVADVKVIFNPDGSLSGQPQLMNPPHDSAWRAHAESAVRAVLKCNPLHVPPQYSPFFEQWKSKTIHFDPQDALG